MPIHRRISAPVDGNPYSLLSVYRKEVDVPEEYLLPNRAASIYDADKLWREHADWMKLGDGTRRHYTTAWNAWSEYCGEKGRHPAFPYVDDVESFLGTKTDCSPNHQYSSYFMPLYRWFKYLMWHAETPHRYNPVVLAVCNLDGVARASWIHARTDYAESFSEAEMEEWQQERKQKEVEA